MANSPEQRTITVWQTVYIIASAREATRSGKGFLTKKADKVIEAFHDAEIEAMMEEAVRTMINKKAKWPD